MQPMDLTAYRDLWKTHGVVALLASALVAQAAGDGDDGAGLAFLAKDAAGNFGWAGVVAGAYSVGMAVASVGVVAAGGPPRSAGGRDRHWDGVGRDDGRGRAAAVQLVPGAAGRGGLAGMFVAPVTSALRADWPRHRPGLAAAGGLRAGRDRTEGALRDRPDVGALVVSFASPRAGVLACGDDGRGAIWWFGLSSSHRSRTTSRRTPADRLHSCCSTGTGCRCWSPSPAVVTGFASMSLGIVAFADEHGNRLIAGVLERLAAIGSPAGGVVGGALPAGDSYVWRRMLRHRPACCLRVRDLRRWSGWR